MDIDKICLHTNIEKKDLLEFMLKEKIDDERLDLYSTITLSKEEISACSVLSSSRAISDFRWEKLSVYLTIEIMKIESFKFNSYELFMSLYNNVSTIRGEKVNSPKLSEKFIKFIKNNKKEILELENNLYDYQYEFSTFGLLTLKKGYLMRTAINKNDSDIDAQICEMPVHMFMRVAIAMSLNDGSDNSQSVESMTRIATKLMKREIMFATPILFNSGANKRAQLASCFLVPMTTSHDTIPGWYDTLKECAVITQMSGGLGLSIHDIRASGSPIDSGSGKGNGIVPLLKQFNSMIKAVDQGGGKRRGSCAIYIEPHHPDILEFLELRLTHGSIDLRCHDLFLSLWVSDLFMERVINDETWSLFCPYLAPGLADVWGKEFEDLYHKYEREKKYSKQVKARVVWNAILDSQANSGQPYMLFKDSCNRKSNQKNRGTIRSSNLCSEIVEYSNDEEIAVCNLSSLCLPFFVKTNKKGEKYFCFKSLYDTTLELAEWTDRIIDLTEYPLERARTSNTRMRPIGIGVQGLYDVFVKLELPWGSESALELDECIHACIYHAAITTSCRLAKLSGPYQFYAGSPASEGKLQYDLWEKAPQVVLHTPGVFDGELRLDWEILKSDIKEHGIRNSLSVALMPTASTSQIAGNSESFEPPTGLLITRRTISGDHIVLNSACREYLLGKDKWNEEVIKTLKSGSVQSCSSLDEKDKLLLRNAWEVPGKQILEHAARRGPYVCQSQSMNICMAKITTQKLNALHIYSYKKKLKTGNYYIRVEDPSMPLAFTACESCSA